MIVRLGIKVQNARKVNILHFVQIRYLITVDMYNKRVFLNIDMFEMSKKIVIWFFFLPLLIYSCFLSLNV